MNDLKQLSNEQRVQDAVSEVYEEERHSVASARRYHDRWMDALVEMAGAQNRSGSVLDLGCGVGRLLARVGNARLAVGIDLSGCMLKYAKRRTPASLVQGNCLHLPFPENSFDLVMAHSIFHHLSDVGAGAREVCRVLRPGGKLVLSDTNWSLLSWLPRRIAYRGAGFSELHKNLRRGPFLRELSTCFQLERVQHFGFLAYPFGFPDQMGPLRGTRFPNLLVDSLIKVDAVLGKLPGIRRLSWVILVTCVKPVLNENAE